jgi:hypothetical protein
MSIESTDRHELREEVEETLLGATEDGLYLGIGQVRRDGDLLLIDRYSDDGKVTATYELDIVIGRRVDAD